MALGLQTLYAQTDPMPYDSIAHPLQANPISDTSIQTRVDLANLTMNPVRVNQAGYRLVDVQESRAQFYVVGTTLPTFQVVDAATGTQVATGALTSTGLSTSGSVMSERRIDAATRPNPMYRGYPKTGAVFSGPVWSGFVPPTVPPGRYRIKTPLGTSVPFVVSANLYGMVRDATIKFFGIQRAGSLADETGLITDTLYSPSWFRSKPAHTWDGWNIDTMGAGAAKYRYKGKLSGGWYDCGDHLKETRTQSFALAILGATAATMPEKDADNYGFNHNDTRRTDGIPDIVREARWGAQFALKAWRLSGGSMGGSTVDSTKLFLSVGDFGKDHGWWGQPQNQDVVVPDRGGRQNRPARIDYGSSSLGDWAAGLAFVSRLYRPFDRTGWSDTALKAARDLYELAKKVNRLESSPAYSGESMSQDDLALASTALFWATKEKKYLDETILTPGLPNGKGGTCGGNQAATFPGSHFEGGFFGCTSSQMDKGNANTDWGSVQSVALYAFFKLFLKHKDTAASYGIAEADRGLLAQRVMANTMFNLSQRGLGSAGNIPLPAIGRVAPQFTPNPLKHDSLWYTMQTQLEWVWNRYQMGNLAELYMYWDMTRYLDPSQISLPDLPNPNWHRERLEKALVNGTGVILGMNQWDMSMLLGVGAKNPGHPHHRAANPEGKNVPGANYNYRIPVGALYGGRTPGGSTTQLFEQWENYHITETCLDGSAVTLLALTGLAENVPNEAPKMDVKVLNTTDTLALVQVDLDKWGTVKLEYGTDSLLTGATKVVLGKDTSNSVLLRIHRLAPSTKYWFKVTATDLAGKTRTQWAWVGSPTDSVRYNFTTKALPLPPAVYGSIKACNVTSDSADIMWYTPNGEYLSSVMFADSANWKAGNYRYVNVDQSGPAPVKFHHVRLYGLKERTTYYFRVGEPGGPYNAEEGCFRTPITDYKFKVYAGQYIEGGLPFLSTNIVNEEERTFDSLSLRVYMRSTDTLWKSPGVPYTVPGPTPLMEPVPLTFENSIGAKYDICIAYNSAGFNMPCDDPAWGINWSWGRLSTGVFMLKAVKIPDSYDLATKTWMYYLEMPLGPTVMNSQSRIRFDTRLVGRSEWPNALQQGKIDEFNYANVFVNRTQNIPVVGDRRWWDESAGPRAAFGHDFVTIQDAPKTTLDWSWMPHSVANGDPVDFPGMTTITKDLFDAVRPDETINPYVAVYRKGVFVYGFSPDKKEQATKRTVFAMDVKYDPPFDVRNGGTINLESSASSRLTGTIDAYDQLIPTAKGFITGIWVNGVELTAVQRRAAVTRNPNGTWKLDLPLRLSTGTNKVDVTIFAGADSTESVDTDVCDEGRPCAFKNSFWFVNTISKFTPSQIAVFDASANPASKVTPDSSIVRVRVNDGNANKNSAVAEVVTVKLVRGGVASGTLTLVETGIATGIFELPVSVVSGTAAAGQVKVLPGDTVLISYQDADDAEDTVSTSIFAVSTWPTPERGGIFRSCGGTYEARVRFDRALPGGASLGAELVSNGGFETPAGTTAGIQVDNGGTLGAWNVLDVDVVHSSILPTAGGTQSLDLNNLRQGSIRQTLATIAGTSYRISFQYSWNNWSSDSDPTKEAVVTWNGVAIDTIRPGTGARTWIPRTLNVTAAGNDVLGFKATKGLKFGMMIDEVSVRSTTGASSPGPELLTNGTFESPVVASEFNSYGTMATISGWTVSNVDLVSTTFQSAFDGTQSMDLNSMTSGSIQQSVSVPAGTALKLSYRWAINAHEISSPTPKRAVVEWNGVVLDTLNALGTETRTWNSATRDVVSAGSNLLTFRSLLGGNAGIMVDAVSLRAGSAAATSNPSTVTVVLRNAPGDSTTLVVPGASTTFDATTRTLRIPLAGVPENGTRTGRAAITISDLSGATKVVSQALSDSVGPWIDSAKIVENLEGRLTDTIAIWASEPMVAPSKTWFFSVTRGGTALPTAAVVVDTAWLSDLATGRWTVVVRTGIVKAGDFLRLVPAQVRDLRGNAAEDCPTLERELKLWVRQAPVSRAWIRDANGDGTADQVVVVYKRALRATEAPGSIRVRFGAADSVRDAVVAPVSGDSVVTIDLPVAYSRGLTSGKAVDGSGSVTLFKAGDSVLVSLTDSVGPALLTARLNYGEAATDTVVLVFSEPLVQVAGTSWMQILKAAAVNLGLAGAPVAIDPTTWKIAVDTGSVVPGDSVRPTSAGRFQDARGKGAAILHPWIEVQGDDRPPSRAWYSDVDGDGRVDRITMAWARAPRTKPSFLLLWPSATGGFDTAGVASTAWVLQADGRSAIVNVGPFDFGVTSSPTTDLGRQISNGVAASFAIHDSVPPRLLTARLSYDGGTSLQPADTLKIVFSEPVAVDLSTSGLEKLIAPATLPVGYRPQVLSADGRNWNIPVDTLSIFPGDSVRPSALVGFSDASGNRPSVLHPWVSVEGAERPPLRAWMKDVDGDGAADQVTVLWARGPRTAPALSFLWPNGRGGFDSVGVAAGSWTLQPDGVSAVLAVGPFAVGVTSSPTTDLGRQNSAGTITSFPVHDSIAAVMTSARLGYAQADGAPDTLHLTWSEPIVWSGVDPLAIVRTGPVPRAVKGTRTVLRPDFLGATIEIDPLDSSLTIFRSGDQIRLSPASAGTVSDRFGNVVEDPTRWVPVVLGRRPPRFQITFDPNKLKYKGWVIQPGPALKLYVKSATSSEWIDFETGNVADGVALEEQGLGPVISLNQPLRGKALLYDNQGTFVANVDLDLLGEAFYAGKIPMDASNQYQVKIQWNGTASTGKPAASGVYLMRLVLWQNVAGEDEEPEYRVVNQVFKCGWEVSAK